MTYTIPTAERCATNSVAKYRLSKQMADKENMSDVITMCYDSHKNNSTVISWRFVNVPVDWKIDR